MLPFRAMSTGATGQVATRLGSVVLPNRAIGLVPNSGVQVGSDALQGDMASEGLARPIVLRGASRLAGCDM